MLIVRDIFTCKPGQAGKMAKLFKKAFANEPGIRVLTDLVGPYNSVMMEMQVETLAEWEAQIKAYMSGEKHMEMDAQTQEEMKNYTELWQTGRREVWKVVE